MRRRSPGSGSAPAIQAITRIVPARYYLVILRGIILKGAPLTTYVPEMAFLALFATVVLVCVTTAEGQIRNPISPAWFASQ